MKELKDFFADPAFAVIVIMIIVWLLIYAIVRWKNKTDTNAGINAVQPESNTDTNTTKSESDVGHSEGDRTGLFSLFERH